MAKAKKNKNKSSIPLYDRGVLFFVFIVAFLPLPTQSSIGFLTPAAAAVLTGWLLMFSFKRRFNWTPTARFAIVCFILIILTDAASYLYHGNPRDFPYIISSSLLLVIFIAVCRTKADTIYMIPKMIFNSAVIVGLLTMASGFRFITFGHETLQGRAYFGARLPFRKSTGLPMSDGEFGILMIPAVIFGIMLMARKAPSFGIKYPVAKTMIIMMAIIICQSRSGYMALIFAMCAAFILYYSKYYRFFAYVFGTCVFIYLNFAGVISWIITGFISTGVLASNAENRGNSFIYALNVGSENPFFGVGHASAIFVRKGGQVVIHNHFFEQFTANGVIAFIASTALVFGLIGRAFWRAMYRRSPDPELRFMQAWCTAALIGMATEMALYRGAYTEYLPIFIGVFCLLEFRMRRKAASAKLPPRVFVDNTKMVKA